MIRARRGVRASIAAFAAIALGALVTVLDEPAGAGGKSGGGFAYAGSKARVGAEVDRSSVGVGDYVTYSITVVVDGAPVPVSLDAIGATSGFEVVGSPQSSTRQSINMNGGSLVHNTSVTVSYTLRAKKIGTYVLGPAHLNVSGTAVSAPLVPIEVVAAGKGAPSSRKKPLDPFDDDYFFQQEDPWEAPPPPPAIPPADPMAKVDAPPVGESDASIFVRLALDDVRPIVGAQVTAKLFVYARRHPHITVKRPPTFADFVTVDLGQPDREWHQITIDGDVWNYATIGAYAVFPLHAGALDIGAAEVESLTPDPFGNGPEHEHQSQPTSVEAIEPPQGDRPAGYVVGDVASELSIAGEVAPRESHDGHALVTLRMRGRGRLDSLRPTLPTPHGVTWTTTDDEARTDTDGFIVHGSRKLTLDVAFDHVGTVDLGNAEVTVWDPSAKAYVTRAAPLGEVRITEGIAAVGSASTNKPVLDVLPAARDKSGPTGEGSSLADHAWTWGGVAAAPLAVLLAQGASALIRRTRKRAEARRDEPDALAAAALRDAREAERANDSIGRAAAMTRAIDRALEAATGVRARGLTNAELARALEGAPIGAATAARVVEALATLEGARFAGGSLTSALSIDDVDALVETLRRARSRAVAGVAEKTS